MSSTGELVGDVKDIIERLRLDAKKKAKEIMREAEKRAKEIIEEAEEKWRKEAEKKREEIIEEARKEAQIIVSETRRKARMIIANAKYEVIEEVFSRTREEIRKKVNIKSSLNNLLRESLAHVTKPSTIYVNKDDVDILSEIINEVGLEDVEIRESNILGGLIIESIEGVKVDNSYDTRLKRAKETLVNKLAEILWSSG
ncbi:MAG: hypothetical protein DRO40_00060 [Thermoprotei archaeon]|nr:MAG: hypothetical protein DRO40_00060 [Thermoprotei archaeon]